MFPTFISETSAREHRKSVCLRSVAEYLRSTIDNSTTAFPQHSENLEKFPIST